MGRTLLMAEAPLPANLIVTTSHYESLGFSAEIRKDQLEATFRLLNQAQSIGKHVIVGDFNFHATTAKGKKITTTMEETVLTSNGYRDVMHDLVGEDEPTMAKSKRFKAWRPDKVVMQSPDGTDSTAKFY